MQSLAPCVTEVSPAGAICCHSERWCSKTVELGSYMYTQLSCYCSCYTHHGIAF